MNYQVPLKYSQNFLKDEKLVASLLNKTNINKSDIVIEIGSGNGIITNELALKASQVISYEKDENLFSKTKNKFPSNVQLINKDFLDINLPEIGYKVFSNIPFSITAEITQKLFNTNNPPQSAYLFMQKEVGQKFLGKPYESQSSVLTKPFYSMRIIHEFQGIDFTPVPSVNVVLVEFIKIPQSIIRNEDKELFLNFVTFAFNQTKANIGAAFKRKIFSNIQLNFISEELGFKLTDKPSQIKFETWMKLFNKFLTIVPRYKQRLVLSSAENLRTGQQKMRKTNLTTINKERESGGDYKKPTFTRRKKQSFYDPMQNYRGKSKRKY